MKVEQGQSITCETLEIKEYERLVEDKTKLLQTKITAMKDKAMETIDKMQSEMIKKIKSDPSINLDLELKISGRSITLSLSLRHPIFVTKFIMNRSVHVSSYYDNPSFQTMIKTIFWIFSPVFAS